ncbi:hypothetical protein ACFFRR_007878 [Megaselia abdita]
MKRNEISKIKHFFTEISSISSQFSNFSINIFNIKFTGIDFPKRQEKRKTNSCCCSTVFLPTSSSSFFNALSKFSLTRNSLFLNFFFFCIQNNSSFQNLVFFTDF